MDKVQPILLDILREVRRARCEDYRIFPPEDQQEDRHQIVRVFFSTRKESEEF